MKVWLDGTLYDPERARVSAFDHGLVVGDGVFETIKVVDGRPFALTRHLDRLRRSAVGLGLPEPDLGALREGSAAVLAGEHLPLGRMRITVTSGPGPLGSDRGDEPGTAIIAVVPHASRDEHEDVVVVPWSRNEHGAVAGLKTTSYADNTRALAYAKERGGGEAIFGNIAGSLCEGTGSNIFVVSEGRLLTPPLSSGCLAGVTRALVLEWFGGTEADLPIGALRGVDEAFLTSTGRDVAPIRSVDGGVLPDAPGPVTKRAMETFARRSAATADP